jgi:uncharacterized protein
MMRRPARYLLFAGILLIVLLLLGRSAIELYTELLWYGQLGYSSVLWRRLGAEVVLRATTSAAGAAVVLLNLGRIIRHLGPVQLRRRYGNIEIAEQIPRGYVTAGIVVAAILAGWWLSGISFPRGSGLSAMAWLYRGSWGVTDPLFGRDLAFFVFTLPMLLHLIDFLLLVTVWSALLAFVGYVLVGAVRLRNGRVEVEYYPRTHFAMLVAGLVVLFAVRYWIGRYGILLGGTGFGDAVGYTDVHARLPAYRILAILCLATAGSIVWSALKRNWLPALISTGLLIAAGFGLGLLYPSIVQKLRVVPNQFAREQEYIGWNLDFTRRAFGIDQIERIPFAVEQGQLPSLQDLTPVLDGVPVWDVEPLQTNLNALEALYGYYHFPSVHFDRYGPTGEETQVALAVREFYENGLPANSRTWPTLHLNANYVRGRGAVVAPAAQKTADGNPVFWLHSVAAGADSLPLARIERAAQAPAELQLTEPSVYFGETAPDYLVLNASGDSAALDLGPEAAASGVALTSFFRVFAFAWRFGDRNLLFSNLLSPNSRLLFRRSVRQRVQAIAPFIIWDDRPHPVIADGRIVWLIDGYTASNTFPIARPFSVPGVGRVRYLRNSVKAVVDGVTGAVSFYAIDPGEPLLAAFARAFPGLLRPLDEMPDVLRRHLRYPLRFLQTQADVLEEYHVSDAAAFFAGQNVWQVPQEPAAVGGGRDYAPIYMMLPVPGSQTRRFLLLMPFIARERQNMTSILLIENDAGSYGRKVLLELPRDRLVSGPRQVRSLIEQDPVISAQLSLWRQGGSDVEIGRLRVVPLEKSILYVQPIFLSGSGNSIPQLQFLVVSDGTSVSMASTLPDAVASLLGEETVSQPVVGAADVSADPDWAKRALDAMQRAERALREGAWAEFGKQWSELQEILRRATTSRGPGS